MATFTNPLTFPHLLLYLSKYSMDDMRKIYKETYGKNLFWSDVPEEFIKMASIPEKLMKSKQNKIKNYHDILPIVLERKNWNILKQVNGQPSKIEYNIFNTWDVLQNIEIKGLLLVSEIYSPVLVLTSFIPLNYTLITGDTLNLSTVTINISSEENTVNQIELGNKKVSINDLIIHTQNVPTNDTDIDIEHLKTKIKEYVKGIKGITPIYNINTYNDSDSASIPIKEKPKKEKKLRRSIIL